MPINIREVLLVIRAKNQATSILKDFGNTFTSLNTKSEQFQSGLKKIGTGAAIAGIGVALGAAGVAGLKFYASMASAAADYNKQTSLTLTQVKQTGVSLQQLEQIGMDVANKIPAPFNQMQAALYMILSSTNATIPQSKAMLESFARAAVAGGTDVSTAGKAVIGVMNAYHLPLTDVNSLLDAQFRMVQFGAGTYANFASVLGRAVPAAVNANQSFQTLAGMMVFMTRNGLSAAQATASAGRALDAIANPNTVTRLNAMGISVKDSAGNFRSLTGILGDLNNKFSGLSGVDKAKAIFDLFKGAGGTIQARRFFDLVFKNFDQFKQYVGDMNDSAGSLQTAYDKMFKSPQSQIQLLKNNWDTLKVTIGNAFIPVLNKVIPVITKLISLFEHLPAPVRTGIVVFGLVLSILLTLAGVILTVVGIGMALGGVMEALGITFGMIAAVAAPVILAIIAIAVAAYLIITHWKEISKFFKELWANMKIWAYDAWKDIQGAWKDVAKWFSKLPGEIAKAVSDAWRTSWKAVTRTAETAWKDVEKAITGTQVWKDLAGFAKGAVNDIIGIFHRLTELPKSIPGKILIAIWKLIWADFKIQIQLAIDAIKIIWSTVVPIIVGVLKIIWTYMKTVGAALMKVWGDIWDLAVDIISLAWGIIWPIVRAGVEIVVVIFKAGWHMLAGVLRGVWDILFGILKGAWNIVVGIIKLGLDIILGHWGAAWNDIVQILRGVWDIIWGVLKGAFEIIKALIIANLDIIKGVWNAVWNACVSIAKSIWSNLKSIFNDGLNFLYDFFVNLPGNIIKWLGDIGNILYNVGASIIQGLWNGMKSIWNDVTGWLGSLGGLIGSLKGPPSKDAVLLVNNGKLVMKGFNQGLKAGWAETQVQLKSMTSQLSVSGNFGGGARGPVGYRSGNNVVLHLSNGAIQINIGASESQSVKQQVVQGVNDAFDELYERWNQKVR